MKKILFLLLILFIVASSCKKEDASPDTLVEGCTDVTAFNYNENADEDDGSCLYDSDGDGVLDNNEVYGCTDTEADNYNSEATEDDNSCIYSSPTADFSYSLENNFAPSLVIFENHSTNALEYNWDFGDGEISSNENPEHVYIEGGQYTITLTVLGLDNQLEIHEEIISINSIPKKLILNRIKINNVPITNNGNNWDIGIMEFIYADIFYILKLDNENLISSNSIDNVQDEDLPVEFIYNLPFDIINLDQEYSVDLWDNDMIQGVGNNEYIGVCRFIPANYMPTTGDEDYPQFINLNNEGIDMVLDISWSE